MEAALAAVQAVTKGQGKEEKEGGRGRQLRLFDSYRWERREGGREGFLCRCLTLLLLLLLLRHSRPRESVLHFRELYGAKCLGRTFFVPSSVISSAGNIWQRMLSK